MKTLFIVAGLVLFLFYGMGRWLFAGSSDERRQVPISADSQSVNTPMPTATATAIPLPNPTGEPLQVQFDRGSYGTTLTGSGSTRYTFWAKQGQILTAAMIGSGYTSLYSVDGQPLYEQAWSGSPITATLTTSGDHLLEIRANGAYTVGVEIR